MYPEKIGEVTQHGEIDLQQLVTKLNRNQQQAPTHEPAKTKNQHIIQLRNA